MDSVREGWTLVLQIKYLLSESIFHPISLLVRVKSFPENLFAICMGPHKLREVVITQKAVFKVILFVLVHSYYIVFCLLITLIKIAPLHQQVKGNNQTVSEALVNSWRDRVNTGVCLLFLSLDYFMK